MSQIGTGNLRQILQEATTPSSYQGVVGSGSTTAQVVDSVGRWATNQWAQYGIQFTQTTVTAALRGVWQQITSNTANTLTLAAALPAAPVEGDTYDIRVFGSQVQDITSWAGQPVATPTTDGLPVVALSSQGAGKTTVTVQTASGALLDSTVVGLVTNGLPYQFSSAANAWIPVSLNVGTPGVTAPGAAVQAAGTDGTYLRAISTDSSGHINVNAAIISSIPAGTNSIGSVYDETLNNASAGGGTASPPLTVQVGGYDGTAIRTFLTNANGLQYVLVTPLATSINDESGTTSTSPGTSTQALQANVATRYLFIQNASSTSGNNLWVNLGNSASEGEGSILLGPGAALVYEGSTVPSNAVNVASNVASLPYTLKWA